MSPDARFVVPVSALAILLVYFWLNVAWIWPYVLSCESDFARYLAAARHLLRGQSPYIVFDFDYPALLAFLLLPLTPWGDLAAHIAWFAMNHCLYVLAAWMLWRELGQDRVAAIAVGAVWALLGAAPQSFALGQINFFLLVLLLLWASPRHLKPGFRDLPIALATGVKLWPGGLLVYPLLRGEWRRFGRALVLILLAVGIPHLAVWVVSPKSFFPASHGYWLGTPSIFNLSLPALVTRIATAPQTGAPFPSSWVKGNLPSQANISPEEQLFSTLAALLSFAVVLAVLARALRNADQPQPLLKTLITLSGLFLALPIVWTHYRLLQAPGLALLISTFWRRRRFFHAVGALVLGLIMTWVPLLGFDLYLKRNGYTLAQPAVFWLLSSLPVLADLVVFFLMVRLVSETQRDKPGPTVRMG